MKKENITNHNPSSNLIPRGCNAQRLSRRINTSMFEVKGKIQRIGVVGDHNAEQTICEGSRL
jgi:hypothetical protein